MAQRIGLGFDVHRLVTGRPCRLGGIELPHPSGPQGHSDGDAVLHAVTDALLGALALGDIGTHFPDKDPRWKDADSRLFVRHAIESVQKRGWTLANLDVVIATEGPRIAPHAEAMRGSMAELLGCSPEQVSVKGKTFEGLGALAGGAGVAVQAVCLLEKSPDG